MSETLKSAWNALLQQWSTAALSSEFADALPDEVRQTGWLGFPSATEEQIVATEQRLGTTLPPSYRAFLAVSNGWRFLLWTPSSLKEQNWLHGEVNHLFKISHVTWLKDSGPHGEGAEMIAMWCNATEDILSIPDEEYFVYDIPTQQPSTFRDEYLKTALNIGTWDDGLLLLNPQVITAEGEWEAMDFNASYPGAYRYRSFWDLMQAEYRDFLLTKDGV